jgi:hypothetical protein
LKFKLSGRSAGRPPKYKLVTEELEISKRKSRHEDSDFEPSPSKKNKLRGRD